MEKDKRELPINLKLTENKPEDLTDACLSGVGQKLSDQVCGELVVAIYGTPRTVAGDSITTDTSKCQLKPLNRSDDYGLIPFTDNQWDQMEALFPEGVCDYSWPGIGFQETVPWLSYGNHPSDGVIYGGEPLPKAPEHSGTGWASEAFSAFAH